jgi:chromosome segregation ATPase
MAIPSVMQGTVEVEGKVFELNSPKGVAWLETIGSFRFEPSGYSKAYTVRREPSGYWYGCRKVAGKVRKKYIGKSSEVSIVKLEEIAEALEVPPVPRVNKVAEVAQEVTQDPQVAEKVAEVAEDRLTALELEVANLRKALEALQGTLPGKPEAGDSEELPNADNAVAEKLQNEVADELQNDLGNLKAENEKLKQELVDARADYAKLLESSSHIKASREKEISELRSQLETELAEVKQNSAAASRNLPEVADLLNQLKAKRKKSTTTLADVEKILEIMEGNI